MSFDQWLPDGKLQLLLLSRDAQKTVNDLPDNLSFPKINRFIKQVVDNN